MNIQDAKDHVKDAVETYLSKDDAGNYVIPRNRQRPIMLLGPPGLGKTAIMSQIAAELMIGYVPYTITHHTRQSAIGLPMIDRAVYGGQEYAVTRYTMSEIIASVHDAISEEGKKEGILFIDEINCVSETLAPAMLDLLQNKKFGPHPIPDGWVLVAAGNPPEYNDSARDYDVATLDRIRLIEVEPDTDVWLRYAMNSGINDAIVYYLKVKPQNLLKIERTESGTMFVTPRAWEDLSTVLNEYESKGIQVGVGLVSQYIRHPEIAAEFNRYRGFYRRYSEDFDSEAILSGPSENDIRDLDSEGRLALISILTGRINEESAEVLQSQFAIRFLQENPDATVDSIGRRLRSNTTQEERRGLQFAISVIGRKDGLKAVADELDSSRLMLEEHIINAMENLKSACGTGPETVSFLTGLLSCYSTVMVSRPGGALYRYNDEMLKGGRDKKVQSLMEGL